MIDRWQGTADLVDQLDKFIARKLNKAIENPYHLLARHWCWEYGSVPPR